MRCFTVNSGLRKLHERNTLCPMKLRLDLLDQLTDEDILTAVVENTHRFKPEPLFSKTGVGSLLSASTEERAQEVEHSMELTRRLEARARQSGSTPESVS